MSNVESVQKLVSGLLFGKLPWQWFCKGLWVLAEDPSGVRRFWSEGCCPRWGAHAVWGSILVDTKKLATLQGVAEYLLTGDEMYSGATRFIRLHDAPAGAWAGADQDWNGCFGTWSCGGDCSPDLDQAAEFLGLCHTKDAARFEWAEATIEDEAEGLEGGELRDRSYTTAGGGGWGEWVHRLHVVSGPWYWREPAWDGDTPGREWITRKGQLYKLVHA